MIQQWKTQLKVGFGLLVIKLPCTCLDASSPQAQSEQYQHTCLPAGNNPAVNGSFRVVGNTGVPSAHAQPFANNLALFIIRPNLQLGSGVRCHNSCWVIWMCSLHVLCSARLSEPQAPLITTIVQADTHLQTFGEPQNYTWVRPPKPIIMSGCMCLWHRCTPLCQHHVMLRICHRPSCM